MIIVYKVECKFSAYVDNVERFIKLLPVIIYFIVYFIGR